MGTRCNILITDANGSELWIYRHNDGYPEQVLPQLNELMNKVKEGLLRDNVGQFTGWLIVIGNKEYKRTRALPNKTKKPKWGSWKCGAYEPTTGQHGDIDFMYWVDLESKTVTHSPSIDWEAVEFREWN